FTLSPLECLTTTPYKASGVIDISNLIVDNKPLYFAFQYKNKPNTNFGNANIWRFNDFLVSKINAQNSIEAIKQANAGWYPVFIGEGLDESEYEATVTEV